MKSNRTIPTPVVLVFHGGGGNPEGMIKLCGMNAKSDQAGFIVVYPFGTGKLEDSLTMWASPEHCSTIYIHGREAKTEAKSS